MNTSSSFYTCHTKTVYVYYMNTYYVSLPQPDNDQVPVYGWRVEVIVS